jgi:hypothetical protein
MVILQPSLKQQMPRSDKQVASWCYFVLWDSSFESKKLLQARKGSKNLESKVK